MNKLTKAMDMMTSRFLRILCRSSLVKVKNTKK